MGSGLIFWLGAFAPWQEATDRAKSDQDAYQWDQPEVAPIRLRHDQGDGQHTGTRDDADDPIGCQEIRLDHRIPSRVVMSVMRG